MSTKIGFNNFKAFGSKMQYFTKKPITLIYGPNSVGKSSVLRALLYKEYLKKPQFLDHKIIYDIDKIPMSKSPNIITNQFGDNFNIGTFENNIHKKDTTKSINYDIEYSNLSDVVNLISINPSFFRKLYTLIVEQEQDLEELTSIFNDILSDNKSNNHELESYIRSEILLEIEHMFLLNKEDLIDDSKKEILNDIFIFLLKQLLLKKIRITTKIMNTDKMEHYRLEHKIYINETLLIKIIESEKKLEFQDITLELYTNNDIFDKIFIVPSDKKLKQKYIINYSDIRSSHGILDLTFNNISNSYETYLKGHLEMILSRILIPSKFSNESYYIGPIRNIPSRKDLFLRKNFFKKQRRKQILIEEKKQKCFIRYKRVPFFSIFCGLQNEFYTICNSIFKSGMKFKYIRPSDNPNHKLWYSMVENKKVKEKVNEWLKGNGKHNSSYSLNNDSELLFYDESTETNVHPQDIGVGISQSLPIITAANLFEDTNILIEQPELHLHPKLQMELADEFIKSIHKNQNDFILETHSEHLLLRIMKRMRQTNAGTLEDESLALTPDDVCILYVDNDGKQTYLQELRLSRKGKLLDHWPNGFFEEGYKERFS